MSLIDISEEVVTLLGLPGTGSQSAQVPASIRWDCQVGGMPFLMAISDQTPMRRETSEFRRQRIDNERNPGEQSLDSGFWIRSQSSWHYGSGLLTAEPLEVNDNESQFRYRISGGIDPWSPGTLSLLNSASIAASASASAQLLLGVDGGVLSSAGDVLRHIAVDGTVTSITWGGSGDIQSLTSDGSNWYAANAGGIYRGTLPSGSGSKIWDTGDRTVIRWVKSRLMATVGKAIYELTGTGPTLPTALDAGAARPSGWVWTDIAEGPTAIYLSGYAGDQSVIERVGVESTTTAVTLDVPTVVADMPRSELVRSLYSYVGSFIVVGTSKGARVASIGTNGSLTMGPLVVESVDGCADAVAIDNFVYVTVGSKGEAGNSVQRAGLYRMDLGRIINDSPLQFAHAPDLVAPAGTAGGAEQVTIAGGKLFFAVPGAGVFRQTDAFVAEGWVETGRIRLGTVEPKSWQDMRLVGQSGMGGTVTGFASVTGADAPSTWLETLTIDGATYDERGTLGTVAASPNSDLFVAIRLSASQDGLRAPVLNGFQVRAMPAPSRTELLSVPVMCFDFEVDRQGARYGSLGGSFQRFKLLKTLEQNMALIQFKDYTTGEQVSAYIERVSYSRTNPPTRQVSGNGGIVTVVLRVLS